MAKKRAQGEGTVFKRPMRRKDGSTYIRWVGEVTTGYTSDGKQGRKTVYGKSQADVVEKMDKIKRELTDGTLADTKLTVAEYLDAWLKEKEPHLKRTTIERKYRYCINKHVKPRIGRVRLEKLRPMQVQVMVREIAGAAGVPTANNTRRVLFTALKQAVRWQLLPRNVVEAVEPLTETPKEMVLWTPQQAARFLDTAREDRFYALFYLCMATGLRRGEVLALRWRDVEGSVVHVRQSVSYVKGEFIFSKPKTKHGLRRIPVTLDVLDVLELHGKRQEAERLKAGELWPDDDLDLIFTTEIGTPFHPDNLTRLRADLMEMADVPRIRLHDLRHLHASVAIKNGMDPKMLADRLGHSRASFTLDTYTHLFEDQRASSAVSLLDFLPKAQELPN